MLRKINEKVIDFPGEGDCYTFFEGYCNSGDTKPTEKVAEGSLLIEVDTGNGYLFSESSGSWVRKISVTSASAFLPRLRY